MGRKSKSGGVSPKGDKIEFDFAYLGTRRRPTIDERPTQTNLRNARRRHERILEAIRNGTFSFRDEFPDYRFLAQIESADGQRTVDQVCESFVASLRARDELAYATVESYRKILKHHVQGKHGLRAFAAVSFTDLEGTVNTVGGTKKTFNNVVSAIRQAWEYGYKGLPRALNPALGLEGVRIPKREQPKPDPFPIDEAEQHIAETLRLWGEEQANYDEARFFTGVRPSEQIALRWPDLDEARAELLVCKARVMARDKDEPKNYEDRIIELNPRAVACLKRQRAIWARLRLEGVLHHDFIFFREDGQPYHDLQVQWKRWCRTQQSLKVRERDPYTARHSSVTWNLMMGKNLLWVADQHGHSASVMLKTYAKWMRGATEEGIEKIRTAFGFATNLPLEQNEKQVNSLTQYGNVAAEREGFEPSSVVRKISGLQRERSAEIPSDTAEYQDLPPDLPLGKKR